MHIFSMNFKCFWWFFLENIPAPEKSQLNLTLDFFYIFVQSRVEGFGKISINSAYFILCTGARIDHENSSVLVISSPQIIFEKQPKNIWILVFK